MSSPTGRAQRVDAQTNRGRVLRAAEQVFGAGGETASTEEVARLAGVGIATVFRHFPTKAVLLEAVVVRHFERLCEEAEAHLEAADAGQAFLDFFAHVVADARTKITILEALLASGGRVDDGPAQASDALRQAFGRLLERAQQAGAVRADVGLPEVYALLVGTSRAAAMPHARSTVRDKMLAIVFDGLAANRRAP